MSDYTIEDRLVEGTGSYQGYLPPFIHKQGQVIPRIHPCMIRQGPYYTKKDNPFLEGFEFIGVPVGGLILQQIRKENKLSNNYGAVFLPKSLLGRTNSNLRRLIVGTVGDNYIIAGLLPTKTLRGDARREMSDEEGIVFASMKEFPNLKPLKLIKKWGYFKPHD